MLQEAQNCVALYPNLHSDVGLAQPAADGLLAWPWRQGLPDEWRDAVIVPQNFRRFRDYEVQAQRIVGVDENDQPCYSHYLYRVHVMRSDDDEDFYEEMVYAESGICWRLRDERWLNYRQVGGRGFFSFSQEMTR